MLFSAISLIFTITILKIKLKSHVLQGRNEIVPVLIFVVTAGVTLVYITKQSYSTIWLFQCMTALLIMSFIAYYDHFSGHIPLFSLVCSTLFGLYVLLLDKQASNFLLGGVTNLIISLTIYLFGVLYVLKSDQMHDEKLVFGFGDVYGLSAMGFLLGFSDSFFGLFLTLILCLVYAGCCSLFGKRPFLKIRLRMGFPMFMSTVIVLTVNLIRGT